MKDILFALALVSAAACATSTSSEAPPPPPPPDDTPADAGFKPTDEAGDTCGGFQCSADMHDVLDGCGNSIKTCPADQGCAPGGLCLPACDAADANQNSIGCNYYTLTPAPYSGHYGCFAAFVVNTWSSPVNVKVERGGTNLDTNTFAYIPTGSGLATKYTPLTGPLPAGEVAILFLSNGKINPCPVGTTAATSMSEVMGTTVVDAFHVTTDAPIVAYDIYPYGGGKSAVTSATLLLPTSSWGDNYIATTPYPYTIQTSYPWIAVIAKEDATDVTIRPVVDILGSGSVASATYGTPKTYTLQRGQVLKVEQKDDLTGSPIQSTKPIGVWGGNVATFLPAAQGAADGMHQQIPPVRALGTEYVAARYRNRRDDMDESPPWRIVGAVDGTVLTYDPPQSGAPKSLAGGEVIEFEAPGPFVIKSQDSLHPFYFAAHMTGCAAIGGYASPVGCAGDPETVNVIPGLQYMSRYVFFTDPTYPETDLVFVRKRAPDGNFKDVTLDCAGTLTGWKSIGVSNYEYTRFDLVRHVFEKQGACDNGRHTAYSDGTFGLTVWGWGSGETKTTLFSEAVSYAYPAGASVQPITSVVVPVTPPK